MALSLRHWIAFAVGGCLVLAVAYTPPRARPLDESVPRARSPEQAKLDRVSRAYSLNEGRLLMARYRDAVERVVRGSQGGPSVQVVFTGGLPEESRQLVRAAAERVWASIAPMPGARLIIQMQQATGFDRTQGYFLPGTLDGRTCVASIAVGYSVQWLRNPSRTAEGTNLEPWLRDAIAPCLYYGAFGQPGPRVAAWLVARGHEPARTADWASPPPSFSVLEEPGRLDYLVSNTSFSALACGDARPSSCTDAILGETENLAAREAADMVPRNRWARGFVAEDHYLAALVREMGRERFTRFWRSSAPVDSAFLAAFGQPMDRWTARWTRHVVTDVPPFGPGPRGRAVFYSLLLGAGLVALTAGLVTRRQVT